MEAYDQVTIPPHLQFANCTTDAELISFVEKFGPVNGTSVLSTMSDHPDDTRDRIFEEASAAHEARSKAPGAHKKAVPGSRSQAVREARMEQKADIRDFFLEWERVSIKYREPYEHRAIVQNLGELRRERMLFRAALELVATLTGPIERTPAGTEAMDQVVATLQALPNGTNDWVVQFEREEAELLPEFGHGPEWLWTRDIQRQLENYAYSASDEASRRNADYASSFASIQGDPLNLSKNALVLLLNAFPLSLNWYGPAPTEAPPSELLHGIRPLLFAMLRRDLLRERQIRKCKWEKCPNYFVATRPDRFCCTNKCSGKIVSKRAYEKNSAKPAWKKARMKARKRSLQDGAATTSKRKGQRPNANASKHPGAPA